MAASSKLIPTPIFYGKRAWPGCPSIQQNWSLPNSIILYIAKNPSSSKVYQILVRTCKFFFETNPIIITAYLDTCKNSTKYRISQNQNERRKCSQNNFECCIKIDLNMLSTKIWITRGLYIQKRIQNSITTIVQKNFRFESFHLSVAENDIIFDDLKFLVSSAKRVFLFENSIKYKNGSIVMLDNILGCLPTNIEIFWFDFGKDVPMVNANASTMKNILKLQNLENLKDFIMYNCPGTLSVEDLSVFLKKFENTNIHFDFKSNISPEYKEQLDYLIDTIIESDVPNHFIAYDGQDAEKHGIMLSRFALNGLTPFNIPDEDEDGFDGENVPVVDETESDDGSTSCIAFLFNKIKNFFM
uniref:Uncharacterized protein n=1 Tax=Panagrolaimus davidi TaxID=227884 RepID=A0A914PB64_9BILA